MSNSYFNPAFSLHVPQRDSSTVHLPSDHLTKTQMEQMCGPCHVYRMKADTPESERADWPDDLKKMWNRLYGQKKEGDAK